MSDPAPAPARETPWWRRAVIYQVYVRSFADGDGDGIGDIAGIRSRLAQLAELGVDALWINPWYPSPMRDAGYDVADPRDVDPRFGTLAQARELLAEAHALGLRVLLDLVPNHFSSQHPWFREALAAGSGSPARGRFIFRAGRGADGDQPPNDWRSTFGGPAWTRIHEPDGAPGQWYLHLFAPQQPDVDWTCAEVQADFELTLRFWFDLGVDGFRIDVAHALAKAPGLPDVGATPWPAQVADPDLHPHWDRSPIHGIYRRWRAIADAYEPPRVFVAEAWVHHPERLARYVRADELHTAFNFDFLLAPWQPRALRAAIDGSLQALEAVGAPATWVIGNHDTLRPVSRYARPQGGRRLRHLADTAGLPVDFKVGRRRARAAALLMLALPGGAYVYQGEELGLPEVEDLPEDALQDPVWTQSGHTDRGRDGCRVPLPWSGEAPPYGFSPPGASAPPWLPQPDDWGALTAAAQSHRPGSMLELYRAALRIRRAHPALGDGRLAWERGEPDTLVFTRPPGFTCVVNLSATPVPLPAGNKLLLASEPLEESGRLAPDTAAWLTASDQRERH